MIITFLFSSVFALLALPTLSHGAILASRNPSEDADQSLDVGALAYRALPNAPNGYTPQAGDCPSTRPKIRSAEGLSSNETSWLKSRRNQTFEPMQDLLGRLNVTGFDAADYFSKHAKNVSAMPNVGLAFSGGGYRALLNGAGAMEAFDSREENATSTGHLGGLLQASTYVAGLSGGNWLVGSMFLNNFTTISALMNAQAPGSVWEFENSILQGPPTGGFQLFDSAQYFDHIYDDVSGKRDAGYNTSITDYWGRALSFQLINATDGGPAYTWSSIALVEDFANGSIPMPIVVADGRAPGELLIPGNTTVYEFNPWEMGSFDPTTYGFVPLEYLGSNFSGGILPSHEQCVRGFDNAGFIMGTSSSLFNTFLLQLNTTNIPDAAKTFLKKILSAVGDDNNDIANYQPNPFYGYHNHSSQNAHSDILTLVDGGESNENIPLHPLIQPFRHVDVIFAVDSSADTDNHWPNGSALVGTYERSLDTLVSNGTAFPAVPDVNTFINEGLNTHPTFFGCNSSNTSSMTPLVVYLPNFPYDYHSNFSTFTTSYNMSSRDDVVLNGYNVVTMGNGTVDSTWPTCVGCAILQRSMERTNTPIPDVCNGCFQRFCWDGRVNSTQPGPYEPNFTLGPVDISNKKKSAAVPSYERSLTALAVGTIITVVTSIW